MQKIKPTAEQLKIRFEAENEYVRELNEHDTAKLFNLVWGWMESNRDFKPEASEEFIKAVEHLQREYCPVAITAKEFKAAQEVAEAIDGLKMGEK